MSRIIIFSGAGISAESGIDTFRDSGGIWEKHKIEDVCTMSTWIKNYDMVHDFYDKRRIDLKNYNPNFAHTAVAELTKKYDVINITTNVDDLLERGGSLPLHIHGDIRKIRCMCCNKETDIGYRSKDQAVQENLIKHEDSCTDQSILKPAVIFFGEEAPEYEALWDIIRSLTKEDVVIVVGASLQVVPIDYYIAAYDCLKININPNLEVGTPYDEWIDIKDSASSGFKTILETLEEMIKNHV